MSELSQFVGKTALVTGAGDGIGEMLAKGLAQAGMCVCVQDIRSEAAQRVAGEIGAGAFPLVADVSDPASLDAAAKELTGQGVNLNLLWLNAGVGVGAPVLGGKPNTINWAFGVNVLGVIWSMQAFWPLLETAEGPRHVGITASSASLIAPEGDFPLYAATKQGTFAVAEALAGELRAKDIGTTILCPGLLNTDIWDAARARPDRFGGVRRMDASIAGQWRAAKKPEAMWPHIAENIEAGGGYLVCPTEPDYAAQVDARHEAIKAGFRPIFD